MNIAQWLKSASESLTEYESARLDAELLLCHVLNCDRTKLYAWPEQELSAAQLEQLDGLITKRLSGDPIAYLVGQREFWSLPFDVSPDVLVPRADTELIVELALQALPDRCNAPILDAGTGSGAIATAVTHDWSGSTLLMIATDISVPALALAKRNAEKHATGLVNFVRSHWLSAFADNTFGMIISNPPYLANDDPHLNNKTLRHEPIGALVSGDDGLDDIRHLIFDACRAGKPDCYVLLEHGATQASAITTLMSDANYSSIQTHQDIAGLDRVTCGYCP